MRIGVPRERSDGERRVAVAPDTVARFKKLGFEVVIEAGAGEGAGFADRAYEDAGATVADADTAWGCEVVAHIGPPEPLPDGRHAADLLAPGALLVCLLDPGRNPELLTRIAARGASAVALERIPRITRAQKMDVLSSMANIAGYRAVVEAAHHFGSFFTGQMTAAGKAPPARVLVIGAGVAGLAAIGAARALGAEVRAFDVRAACQEQVESMGARFLKVAIEESGEGGGGYAKTMSEEFIAAEMALFLEQARQVDVIITTALIPGKPAPRLILAEHVRAMKPGSVIVDLAAATGGNCERTQPGKVVVENGVTLIGHLDLTSRMAPVASRFFGQNIAHLLDDMGGAKAFRIDLEDEVLHQSAVVQAGQVRWPVPPFPHAAPPPAPAARPTAAPVSAAHGHGQPAGSPSMAGRVLGLLGAVLLALAGLFAPGEFLQHLTVFILACFVGWQLIWNVTPALHTPLMSVTNAISGIIVLGGMLTAGSGRLDAAAVLGAVAIFFASINIAGGFLVTQRMLRMFHR